MGTRRVLVADANDRTRAQFRRLLASAGLCPIAWSDLDAALNTLPVTLPDALLLELPPRDKDQSHLFYKLRVSKSVPSGCVFLMTSCVGEDARRIAEGVAGSIYSKWDAKGLVNRIQTSIQRPRRCQGRHALQIDYGCLEVDLFSRSAFLDGMRLPHLHERRFDLLAALAFRNGMATQEELLADLWGLDHDPKVVAMTASRLRKDLANFRYLSIATEKGSYRLVIDLSYSLISSSP